jgi:hypothetical protein
VVRVHADLRSPEHDYLVTTLGAGSDDVGVKC